MEKIKGKIYNIKKGLTGKITFKNNIFEKGRILICKNAPFVKWGIKALLLPENNTEKIKNFPLIKVDADTSNLNEGDVVTVNSEGEICVVWENNSPHNGFYVTDICNSKCIMCPQVCDGKSRFEECFEIIKHVDLKSHQSIGITGGEPTLEIDKLVKLLNLIAKKSKNSQVEILTNGRGFKNVQNVTKIAQIKNCDITLGIPLYSNIAEEHDFLTGVKGSFCQTIEGLYNLAMQRQKIEIRIVVLKQNYKILKDMAEYIYRNLPFVTHVAIMGAEYHGNAQENYNQIAVDPLKYKQELYEAVKQFVRYDICTNVYNIPLCLADERIHDFCTDSISTWKKTFLPECEGCLKKQNCSGVFKTSFVQSENIRGYYNTSCVPTMSL